MKGGAGVRLQCADGVARVTLDRPGRLNAVDAAADAALDEIWTALEGDPAVRCVVLTGSGRAFCAGADLKEDGPDGLAYWAGTGTRAPPRRIGRPPRAAAGTMAAGRAVRTSSPSRPW